MEPKEIAFDPEDYKNKASQRKIEYINEFSRVNNLSFSHHTNADRILFLLDDNIQTPLSIDFIDAIIEEQKTIEKYGAIRDNCYGIAAAAVHDTVTQGVILIKGCRRSFLDFYEHALPYTILPDGSIVVIDYTASRNFDYERGNFHILMIKAANYNKICKRLEDLYGGAVFLMPIDEIELYFQAEFGDKDQQSFAKQELFKRHLNI